MRCKDLEILLSAYADGELEKSQRDFVETHLSNCSHCQSKLEDLTLVARQLKTLRINLPIPSIKEETMTEIKKRHSLPVPRPWRRPVLVVVPAIAVLIAFLAFYIPAIIVTPGEVIAKAYNTAEALTSFKISSTLWAKWPGTTAWVNPYYYQYEYAGEKTIHIKAGTPEGYFPESELEVITLNNKVYVHEVPYIISKQITEQEIRGFLNSSLDNSAPSLENTLTLITSLVNIQQMPDERINGVDCFHYQGDIDMEKWKVEVLNKYNREDDSYQYAEAAIIELSKTRKIKVELWIGKEDYLIRQDKQAMQLMVTSERLDVTTNVYTDFNVPIQIKPPVTESGELIEGWQVFEVK